MNTEVQNSWISALRSGEYKQAQRSLRREDGFCCLGVLCELYKKETGKGEWVTSIRPVQRFDIDGYGDDQYLPISVREWAGLKSSNPCFLVEGNLMELSDINDHGGTFEQIADIIEKGQEA